MSKNNNSNAGGLKVDNAIILAAGFGSRAVPLTYEMPKGLIPVNGTPIIEKQIMQLKEKGIDEIIIVEGHLKGSFDYLIEKYGVKLIFNPEFSLKNNLSSLYIAKEYLKNSYVILSDLYMEKNIFNETEDKSWIGCKYFEGDTDEWVITTDEEAKIDTMLIGGNDSLAIVGPAFLNEELSKKYKKYLEEYYSKDDTDDYYWEHIFLQNVKDCGFHCNDQTGNLFEFENLQDLRDFDKSFLTNSGCEIMNYIAEVHDVSEDHIVNIIPLTSGMTNQSMIYEIDGTKYVFRLPGVGTDKLIDRSCEKKTYDLLEPYDLTDEIVHFNTKSGIKISKYYDGARVMDPFDDDDFATSMQRIRQLHDLGIEVPYRFDMSGKIAFYQTICDEINAIRFKDIEETKGKVQELLAFIDKLAIPEILCHGDTVYTNLLVVENGECRIIDWEYCGAGDPIMDVAMYDIYAYYDLEHVNRSIELYLGRKPTDQERARLYIYVGLGGYLWSLWTEYKEAFGDNFGDYSMTMYNYLKDYYDILKKEGLLNLS